MRVLSTFAETDTLSDVLRSLRVRSTVFCLALMDAPWGFEVPGREVASFHLVLEGRGLLEVEGEQPLEILAGDLVLLPHGDAHAVRDRLETPATAIARLAPETETSFDPFTIRPVIVVGASVVCTLSARLSFLPSSDA